MSDDDIDDLFGDIVPAMLHTVLLNQIVIMGALLRMAPLNDISVPERNELEEQLRHTKAVVDALENGG